MLFWCEQREFASPDELELIGTLEFALDTAISLSKPCVGLLISKLAEQRRRLKKLAVSYLPRSLIKFDDDRLLDAQAYEVFDLLVAQSVPVHPCLRPCQSNIYHQWSYGYLPEHSIVYAEALWRAGFRDVTAANCNEVAMAPLLFHSIQANPTWCKFLISKGAQWTEKYPSGRTTTAHVFGQAIGNFYSRSVLSHNSGYQLGFTIENKLFISRLFNENCTDKCCCGCSRSGCLFITTWIKGATESISHRSFSDEEPKHHRILTYTLVLWAAPVARMSRWVASALTRSLTFWKLGIRHTCCDIQSVLQLYPWSDGRDPEPPMPRLRYHPELLQEVMEEDAFLLSRLEYLVSMFDAQYDSRGEDIVDFITGYWSETMLSELEDLARTDYEEYGEGRRHLGIDLATKVHEGNNRSTLEEGLTGEVNLDTLVDPCSKRSESSILKKTRIRDVVPVVHTLDEAEDVFHEAEEGFIPSTPTS